jgi:hypothetical protein
MENRTQQKIRRNEIAKIPATRRIPTRKWKIEQKNQKYEIEKIENRK